MSTFIRKSHNVSVLLYHVVCGSKYRRAVFNADVDVVLKEVCLEIALRHEIAFLGKLRSLKSAPTVTMCIF